MRRWLLAGLLVPGLLLAGQAPARAHADLVSATPGNGATVAKWPSEIRLAFSEPVQVQQTLLLDDRGRAVPAPASASGTQVRLAPQRRSARAATVSWSVVSDDGHVVEGASSFLVGGAPKPGAPVRLATTPAVPASIDGTALGRHIVTITSKATSGEAAWSHPALLGPIVTPISGSGGKARTSVVLGLPGPWTLEMTLVNPDYTVIVVKSSLQVRG